MVEQERRLYWDGSDSCKSKEYEGLPMNRYGMRKRHIMVLVHIMTKRPAEGVRRCQQEEPSLSDGRGDVIVCHQGLLWEIPSDERVLQRTLKSTPWGKESVSSTDCWTEPEFARPLTPSLPLALHRWTKGRESGETAYGPSSTYRRGQLELSMSWKAKGINLQCIS